MTRRTLFYWHSWIGLTGGLLLFVICWSGTVAVFSRDLDRLADARLSAPPSAEVAWQSINDKVEARFPDWTITQIARPIEPGFAAETWAEDSAGVVRRIYSDPATGEVLGATSYFNIQRFFRSFHMSLFIGEPPVWGIPIGYLIVGLFSFVLLASGITSLIFYKRFWRGFLRLHLNKGAKIFWSDLHKLAGLWGLWFLLAIALTGGWYLIEWKAPEGRAAPQPPATAATARPLPIGVLVGIAQRAYPELRINVVATYDLQRGLLEVQGQDGSLLVRNRAAKAWVNAYTGEVAGVQRPAELSAYQRWIDTADPLHFGDFGGLGSKSIWFLFGIGLSAASLTGAYLQAKRQQRHGAARRRIPILIAYGATIALLGVSTAYGLKEAMTYGTDGQLPDVTALQLAIISTWVATTVGAISLWMWKVR